MRKILTSIIAFVLSAQVCFAQFSQQVPLIGTAGGSANALTFSVPNAGAYSNILNVVLTVIPAYTNTSATTINVNSFGTEPVKKPTASGLVALGGGELVVGQPTQMYWDGSEFVIVGNAFNNGPIPVPVGVHGFATFTTAGTYSFTVPANVYWIYVAVTGGGGGGNFNNGLGETVFQGQGGCAGGTSIAWLSVTPSQVISGITVGAAGRGALSNGTDSTNGGSSSFSYLSASGGVSGSNNDAGTGLCAPGVGSGGQLNLSGGVGSAPNPSWIQNYPTATSTNFWGQGGASYYGPATAEGVNGVMGAGGGGCGGNNGTTQGPGGGSVGGGPSNCTNGGNGGAGAVIVSW